MRRTTRYRNIHRHHFAHGADHAVTFAKHSTIVCAITHGDNNMRLRRCLDSLYQGNGHIPRDGPGDENTIGVAGRGDETSPKALGVIHGPEHRRDLDLAAIARSRVNMTELQRSDQIPRSPLPFINGTERLGDTTGAPQCPPQL